MARALDKVQKKISKKRNGKNTNALHENSRDAQRLRQAGAREDKLARMASVAAKSNQIYVNRIAWAQETLSERDTPLNDAELHELIEHFIVRDNDELSELKAAQRPGRPKSKEEERIQARIDSETKEYNAGLWMAEVRDQESLEKLKRWGGSWGGLNTLKYVRVVKDADIKSSSFPPKGLS